jgi:hypothetical protein
MIPVVINLGFNGFPRESGSGIWIDGIFIASHLENVTVKSFRKKWYRS